jgi:hypothetical protein
MLIIMNDGTHLYFNFHLQFHKTKHEKRLNISFFNLQYGKQKTVHFRSPIFVFQFTNQKTKQGLLPFFNILFFILQNGKQQNIVFLCNERTLVRVLRALTRLHTCVYAHAHTLARTHTRRTHAHSRAHTHPRV